MSSGSGERWTSTVHGPSRRSRRRGSVALRSVIVIMVVVAVVAGTIGYLIGDHVAKPNASTTTKAAAGTSSALSTAGQSGPTATTVAPASIDRTRTVVVVANGSDVKGAAAVATSGLKTFGYKTLTPANTSASVKVPFTQVFFADGGNDAAAQVIRDLHLTNVVGQLIPVDATQIPLAASSRQTAAVVVILGADLASSFAGTPSVSSTVPATSTAATAAGGTTGSSSP